MEALISVFASVNSFVLHNSTHYKDALKFGFYELQTTRDWYREVTQDVGMHVDLVKWWIRVAVLLICPIAPHFSEHIWTTVLKEPKSVQLARWPEVTRPIDRVIVDSGAYMRGLIKTMRDAELSLLKKMNKGKQGQAPYDPTKPRAVTIYVATSFPQWQDQCVQIVKDAYVPEADKVDDAKVRELLMQRGFIKDKRAMPFVQAFKVGFIACDYIERGTQSLSRNVCNSSARRPHSIELCPSPKLKYSGRFFLT